MLYSEVIAHLQRRADALLAGRLDDLLVDYAFPVPVDLEATRVIVRNAVEGRALLALQRLAMASRGVQTLRPEVTALDLPRDGRFRIWVDWHEASPEGVRLSSAVYYCRRGGPGLRIEMINYHRLSMPELQPQFAALALSA